MKEFENGIESVLPNGIKAAVDGEPFELITRDHRSGDQVYKVGEKYILKVSDKKERLRREYEVNRFLEDKLPSSVNVLYESVGGFDFYLKTNVPGTPLSYEKYISNPLKVVDLLVQAMKMVHSVDISQCTLKNYDSEEFTCFVHGDFCLPNLLATGDRITGIVDTEAGGIGDPWVDYAWAIWSLEYNTGAKEYTSVFLQKMGIEFDKAKYEKYIGESANFQT